jgi:hypothetical protein
MRLYRLACLIFFFALSEHLQAQDGAGLRIEQKQWEKISGGIDYTETYRKGAEKKSARIPVRDVSGFNFSSYKYIFYFLVLALLMYLGYRVLRNFSEGPEMESKTISVKTMQEIEEKIHEIDLEDLLQQALSQKNFRIALRLHFLIIIKLLSQREKISWAREKTNWEYYAELRDKLMADQFKEIVQSFETFWYGEHALSEAQYLRTEQLFTAMQKRLRPNE